MKAAQRSQKTTAQKTTRRRRSTKASHRPRSTAPATSPIPFTTRALAQLLMSDQGASYGLLLRIANEHVDAFLGTGDDGCDADIGRLDDVVKAIMTDYERGNEMNGPSYVDVEQATTESDLRIEVGAHGEKFLSDITCKLRSCAMQAGFALGLALALRMGGAR